MQILKMITIGSLHFCESKFNKDAILFISFLNLFGIENEGE